jgi:hypothetical protein
MANEELSFLKRVPIVFGALSAAVAAVSPTLIRNSLIPDQLAIIGLVGSVFVLLAFLLAWAYRAKVKKHLRKLLIIAFASLVLLVLLQIFFVETIDDYGNPPATHRFVVGYALNKEGRSSMAAMGVGSKSELIKFAGADRIAAWFGVDYYIVLVTYTMSYITLILSSVLAIGAITISENRPH